MKLHVEEVNGARCEIDVRAMMRIASLAIVMLLLVCCSGEKRAERLYREADKLAANGDPVAAVARLEKILREYPDSDAASVAREKIELYRGLVDAVARFPQRRAREVVVAMARAIERYRVARRGLPETLDPLVPEFLDALSPDPWGGKILYERNGPASYRLVSLGEDGVRGGDGDAADIVVINGRFSEDVKP